MLWIKYAKLCVLYHMYILGLMYHLEYITCNWCCTVDDMYRSTCNTLICYYVVYDMCFILYNVSCAISRVQQHIICNMSCVIYHVEFISCNVAPFVNDMWYQICVVDNMDWIICAISHVYIISEVSSRIYHM